MCIVATRFSKRVYPLIIGENDTVMVKFTAIDDDAYEFWRNFEDMADLSRNPLFPVVKNLHSNVSGALGYWFGYGSTFYLVKGIGINKDADDEANP